jgi:hypothetical protein
MFFSRRRIATVEPCASALVRTRYSLAECVVCGYEEARSGPGRLTCRECGATVHVSELYINSGTRAPALTGTGWPNARNGRSPAGGANRAAKDGRSGLATRADRI